MIRHLLVNKGKGASIVKKSKAKDRLSEGKYNYISIYLD